MIRFSANLGFLWAELPLLERIERAAGAGFRAIELHWPYDTPAADVRRACADHGLILLGLNTPVGSAPGDFGLGAVAGREAEFRSAFEQALAYCVQSQAKSIHVMAGNVLEDERAKARDLFIQNLGWAAGLAQAEGVTLLIEPINRMDKPDYFLNTIEQGAQVISDLGSRTVRVMFDCYHVGRETGDVLRRLRQYRDIIGHIQIAAVPSRAEPDEGELNYGVIFNEIVGAGYDGHVGCEYRPRATTEAGLSWVGRLGQRLG